MLALRVGSAPSIASIKLTLTLEGPTPWKAKGDARASRLCWFLTRQGPLQQDVRRGAQHDAAGPRGAAAAARTRSTARDNWEDEPPAERHRLESLREICRLPAPAAVVVHPVRHADDQPEGRAAQHRRSSGSAAQRPPTRDRSRSRACSSAASADARRPVGAGVVRAGAVLRHERRGEARRARRSRASTSGVRVGEHGAAADRLRRGARGQYELKYIDSQRDQRSSPPGAGPVRPSTPRAFNAWALQGAIGELRLSFARAQREVRARARSVSAMRQEAFAVVLDSDLHAVRRRQLRAAPRPRRWTRGATR